MTAARGRRAGAVATPRAYLMCLARRSVLPRLMCLARVLPLTGALCSFRLCASGLRFERTAEREGYDNRARDNIFADAKTRATTASGPHWVRQARLPAATGATVNVVPATPVAPPMPTFTRLSAALKTSISSASGERGVGGSGVGGLLAGRFFDLDRDCFRGEKKTRLQDRFSRDIILLCRLQQGPTSSTRYPQSL